MGLGAGQALALPRTLVSNGLSGEEGNDCPRRLTLVLCFGSKGRCPDCAPLLGTAFWDPTVSSLVTHLCLEGLQLGFSGRLLPLSLISELEHFTGEKTRAEREEKLPELLC